MVFCTTFTSIRDPQNLRSCFLTTGSGGPIGCHGIGTAGRRAFKGAVKPQKRGIYTPAGSGYREALLLKTQFVTKNAHQGWTKFARIPTKNRPHSCRNHFKHYKPKPRPSKTPPLPRAKWLINQFLLLPAEKAAARTGPIAPRSKPIWWEL